MRALTLFWLLTVALPARAQPAGEPTGGAELAAPNTGPTPQAPVPTTFKRGIVLRYEDIDKRGVLTAPTVVLAPSAAQSSSAEGPVAYALRDDGTQGDPVASDGRWSAWGEFTPGLDYSVTLHDGGASAPALHTLTARFEMEQSSPTIYFHATRGRFEGGAQAETGTPASASVQAPAALPPSTDGDGALADAPPDPPSDAPTAPPRPDGTAVSAVTSTDASLPDPLLYGAGALSAALLAGGAWVLLAGRTPLVLAGRRPAGRPFGAPGFADGAVAWVLPPEVASEVLRDCLRELLAQGPMVVVPRAGTDLSELEAGAVWRLRTERPDPADVARATRRLGRGGMGSRAFDGPAPLLVEGPEALEAPLPGESPSAVQDELRARVGRAPVLFVLREGEAIPANTRVVRFATEPDGTLVTDGVRLVRRDGRWAPLSDT